MLLRVSHDRAHCSDSPCLSSCDAFRYKRVQNEFTGTLTGKAIEWGGSNIRPEATGYGAVYFGLEILKDMNDSIQVRGHGHLCCPALLANCMGYSDGESQALVLTATICLPCVDVALNCVCCCLQGKRCMVSGSGNVAQYAARKLLELGATVLTMSDSTGYIYEPNGFTMEQIDQVMDIKNNRRTTLADYSSPTGE